jgi:hypothetical protein
LTEAGAVRLAAELARAQRRIHPPALVWVFDVDLLEERRAVLYGWAPGAPPRALLVWHDSGPADRVQWVCEPFVRSRHE